MLDVIDEEFVTFYEFINIKATEQQGMLFCGVQTTFTGLTVAVIFLAFNCIYGWALV